MYTCTFRRHQVVGILSTIINDWMEWYFNLHTYVLKIEVESVVIFLFCTYWAPLSWHKPTCRSPHHPNGMGFHFFTQDGWTPLLNAVYANNVRLADIVLKAGARVDLAMPVRYMYVGCCDSCCDILMYIGISRHFCYNVNCSSVLKPTKEFFLTYT